MVCYQYKNFANIDIIGFNVLLRYLSCTKVAVSFSNLWVANLPLM